ncbi:MAG: NAD(P)-dependent alcohol dehydrogenase [Candidatus Hydrogenedentota bacterium]
MRAWRFSEFGDILEQYKMVDVDRPVPEDGEVLIRLNYASINPADRLLIEGLYPGAGELPLTVGRDGSGTVIGTSESSRFNVGDEVLILRSTVGITRQGTLAEYVTAGESVVAHVPEGWSMAETASAALVYLTAWKALVLQGKLKEGETVLVTGATGGVGIAAVQLAKAMGANVIAMTRDAAKGEKLRELGADHIVDSATDDLAGALQSIAKDGISLIIENIAGPELQSHIDVCGLNGRIMVIGLLAGRMSEINLGPVLFKQLRIEGVHVGKFVPNQAQEAWRRIVDILDNAGAKPLIAETFPMDQTLEAFDALRAGHMGKIVIQVDSLNDE